MSDWSPLLTTNNGRTENANRDQRARNDEAGAALLAMTSQSFAHVLDDRIGARDEATERYQKPSGRERTEEKPESESGRQRHSLRNEGTKVNGQHGNSDQAKPAQDNASTDKVEPAEDVKAETPEADESAEQDSKNVEKVLQGTSGVTGHQGSPQSSSTAGATGSATVGPAGAIRLAEGWRTIQSMAQQAKTEAAADQNQQPAQIRSQVLQAMQQIEGLSDGKGVIKLHLDPAHLGKIEITIQRKGQQLEVTFKVESAEAEQALRDRSSELGQSILGKGTSWNEVNVTIELDSDEEESEEMADSGEEHTPPHDDEDSDQDEARPEPGEGEAQ